MEVKFYSGIKNVIIYSAEKELEWYMHWYEFFTGELLDRYSSGRTEKQTAIFSIWFKSQPITTKLPFVIHIYNKADRAQNTAFSTNLTTFVFTNEQFSQWKSANYPGPLMIHFTPGKGTLTIGKPGFMDRIDGANIPWETLQNLKTRGLTNKTGEPSPKEAVPVTNGNASDVKKGQETGAPEKNHNTES
ncbi:hypothetical protein DdX_17242 [Ditylenchus destructor]|uniref:Uncharacterized protein n=1 Tax=Ditylenchus destructor TaxID=166010 RepID=A0AAD4MMH3_9BILA|nr:hypothetical protein DdX_17242 [Ditylenchus destructor]